AGTVSISSASCLLSPLPTGPADAGVTQTPRSLVTEQGQNVTLNCEQDLNHDVMYWYRQDPQQVLQLIYYSVGIGDKIKGEATGEFDVIRKETRSFFLKIFSLKTTESWLYFCGSSLTTVLLHPFLHVHEPPPARKRKQEAGPGRRPRDLAQPPTRWTRTGHPGVLGPAGGQGWGRDTVTPDLDVEEKQHGSVE
uniref:Immunoglobulin V-set domain-containing protein n=1 Tax=Ornithorhynchus anatinus TaxID=9258 RepID=A0A6I8P095_ORNAN